MPEKNVIVRNRAEVAAMDCPYGTTERIVTAGEGGVANVHVVTVTCGTPHFHQGYDETYYVLSGSGKLVCDGKEYRLSQGSVAIIPAGVVHSLESDSEKPLEFVIFGTPPLSLDDAQARPKKPL
jgi:mannose-6-phosphate isomerase-like protein (cupin superfamily)